MKKRNKNSVTHESAVSGGAASWVIGLGIILLLSAPANAAWEVAGVVVTPEIYAAQMEAEPGVAATAGTPYFSITADDVAVAVAAQLQAQAVAPKVQVTLAAGADKILYSANRPLNLIVHALQVDTQSHRWQAQANIIAGGKTVSVKPVGGIYVGLVDVPVFTRQMSRNDIIESGDLTTKSIPETQLRKETVTDAGKLIGLSPRAVISANRPIRQSEVNLPIIVKKGENVQMTYTTPSISIKTSGVALQDGAMGDNIRVKNDKSEKAVSGHVAGEGHIEVNPLSLL